jgi:hypothetical protein
MHSRWVKDFLMRVAWASVSSALSARSDRRYRRHAPRPGLPLAASDGHRPAGDGSA